MRMLIPSTPDWAWSRRSLSPTLMGDAFDDFDRIVDSFLRPTYATTVNFQPSCDIRETKNHYLVSFDMPGVKKDFRCRVTIFLAAVIIIFLFLNAFDCNIAVLNFCTD